MADDSTLVSPGPEMTAPAPETQTTPESVPAPQEAPEKGFHEFSQEERREFLKSGTAPKKDAGKAKDSDGKAADSSTAPAKGKKAAETAASDTAPASETGKPAKDTKARNSEESRVLELLDRSRRAEDEARELRKRLDALEQNSKPKADAKPDSSTAANPSEPKWKKYRQGAPDIKDFEDPNDWAAAMSAHITEQISKEVVAATLAEREQKYGQQAEQHREIERVIATASERVAAEEKAHPELVEKVNPKLRDLPALRLLPEGIQPNADHLMKDCIVFESDHPLQLSAFYSTEEGWKEWTAMRGMDRRGIERTIARRDILLGQSSAGTPAPAPVGKVAKTHTSAPPPPDKSGPKSATTADGADQAVKSGDFATLVKELDEREGVQTRRYGLRRG